MYLRLFLFFLSPIFVTALSESLGTLTAQTLIGSRKRSVKLWQSSVEVAFSLKNCVQISVFIAIFFSSGIQNYCVNSSTNWRKKTGKMIKQCEVLYLCDWEQIKDALSMKEKSTTKYIKSIHTKNNLIKESTAMEKKRTHVFSSQCATYTSFIHIINVFLLIAVQCIAGKSTTKLNRIIHFYWKTKQSASFIDSNELSGKKTINF